MVHHMFTICLLSFATCSLHRRFVNTVTQELDDINIVSCSWRSLLNRLDQLKGNANAKGASNPSVSVDLCWLKTNYITATST